MSNLVRPRPTIGERSDEERFGLLFNEHRAAVLAFAVRRTSNREDAADVVAETFFVAWRKLDDVPVGDRGRAWLIGVARNLLLNTNRGQKRGEALSSKLKSELTTLAPSFNSEVQDSNQYVTEALDQLSQLDRELLTMSAWDELSPREIALALDMNRATVRSRLLRARRRFKALVDATPDQEPGRTVTLPIEEKVEHSE